MGCFGGRGRQGGSQARLLEGFSWVFSRDRVLRSVLRRGVGLIEGAQNVLQRQKHALSQSTAPLCVLLEGRK